MFESTLDAEQEEEERRQLAVSERWYSDEDDDDEGTESGTSPKEGDDEQEDQEEEDENNIWDESEPEEGEFKDLYKRGNSKNPSRRKGITSSANRAKKLGKSKKGLIGYRDTVSLA